MSNTKDINWKEKLSNDEYHVSRNKGTERPFTGKYNMHFENGIYVCRGCGTDLFYSTTKFESGCGWPSFDQAIAGKVRYETDHSLGMKRVEILCNNCDGHLGHVFDDGPTQTGQRYCVNSLSLEFNPKSQKS